MLRRKRRWRLTQEISMNFKKDPNFKKCLPIQTNVHNFKKLFCKKISWFQKNVREFKKFPWFKRCSTIWKRFTNEIENLKILKAEIEKEKRNKSQKLKENKKKERTKIKKQKKQKKKKTRSGKVLEPLQNGKGASCSGPTVCSGERGVCVWSLLATYAQNSMCLYLYTSKRIIIVLVVNPCVCTGYLFYIRSAYSFENFVENYSFEKRLGGRGPNRTAATCRIQRLLTRPIRSARL